MRTMRTRRTTHGRGVTAAALLIAVTCVVGATAAGQQAQADPAYKKVGSWGKPGTGNGQFKASAKAPQPPHLTVFDEGAPHAMRPAVFRVHSKARPAGGKEAQFGAVPARPGGCTGGDRACGGAKRPVASGTTTGSAA